MPKEPAYVREFQQFTRGTLEADDLPKLEPEMYGANDRACAVMFGSIVETALRRLIEAKMPRELGSDDTRLLFDFSAPLGNFSSKIIVAFAFGLIGRETRHDLDLIRMLRNEFAHSRRPFGFDTSQASAVCKHIKSPDWPGSQVPPAYLEYVKKHDPSRDVTAVIYEPRTRYITACHVLAKRLLLNTGLFVPPPETIDLR